LSDDHAGRNLNHADVVLRRLGDPGLCCGRVLPVNMARFGDLTTLADVRAWLSTGSQAMPPTDDLLLQRLITAASQFIQTWLSRSIASQDYYEVRDGTGGRTLQFGAFPVTSVLEVVVDAITIQPVAPFIPAPPGQAAVWQPSTFTVGPAGYLFTPTQITLHGYFFSRRPQNVQLTYTAGYRTVPSDVAQACIELTALRYRERTRIGEVSKHLGTETITYSQRDMPADVMTVLTKYKAIAPVSGWLTQASTQSDPATLVAAI
jgi:hypothetical protein